MKNRKIDVVSYFVFFLLSALFILSSQLKAKTIRECWIAAEKVSWSYAPSGKNLVEPKADLGVWGESLTYTKYQYIGYTDSNYKTPIAQPEWAGILGPQIRAVVGDTIKVYFLNKTDRPLSIHPHGVFYKKEDEGADGGKDSSIQPGERYTYTWIADEDTGPGP